MPATPTPRQAISVLDFGADPTGSRTSDDAIQRAMDVAFGGATFFTPNYTRRGTPWKCIPVYIPRGTYLISKTLFILGVHSGYIFGDGMDATILKWVGQIPGGTIQDDGGSKGHLTAGVPTNMFLTNGWGRCFMRDLQLDMQSGPKADATICFNWNWDGGSGGGSFPGRVDANTSQFRLKNVFFRNATFGFSAGILATIGPYRAGLQLYPPNYLPSGNSNAECDTATFVNCIFDNCGSAGLSAWGGNCIGYSVYGGSVTNCGTGIIGFTAVSAIIGVMFSGNGNDIRPEGVPLWVSGCNSNSLFFLGGRTPVIATCCQHTPASAGIFAFTNIAGVPFTIDRCYGNSNSNFVGGGDLYIRDSQFDARNPFPSSPVLGATWSGRVIEWQLPTGAFASLPSSPQVGMEQVVTDATVNSFGANITAGGGANNVLARWNGAHWTVRGA
jgi:hypothetical protein